ncbi:MAG: hypothetical protein H6710_01250 [Myxococcales bacterium]|nr:hypothetical protein [Myxococcales bacterium]
MLLPAPLVLTLLAPPPAADLEAKVKAIFDDKCVSCHDKGDDLVLSGALEAHVKVMGATGTPMVAPGKPDESYLVVKLVGGKGMDGDLMPMGDDPLPKKEIEAVRAWISALGDKGGGAAPTPAAAPAPTEAPAKSGPTAAELEPKVAALFEEKCNMCHDTGAEEVVLSGSLAHLTTDKGVNGQPFIVPGDVEASYLWVKLKGGPKMQGELMPMGDDPLGEAEMALVRDYIVALAGGGEEGGGGEVQGPSAGGGVEIGGDTGEDVGPSDGGGEDDEPVKRSVPFHGTFQHNLPTTAALGKRRFEFRIDHRFGRVGTERGAFGLDAGVVMSVGFAYGITDGLDVLLRRSNSRKDYELGVKYIPLRQEAGAPLSVGGFVSLEYLRDFKTNSSNPWVGNFQAMVSRLWFDRWSTMLLVGYYLRTNHAANVTYDFGDGKGPVAARDTRNSLGIGVASSVWLGKRKRWGVDMEYHLPIPSDKFYYNGGNADPNGSKIGSWSLGASYFSGLHYFQIFLNNTREIHTNLYGPGGQTKNPFENRGNFFLGFNLSRKWTIKAGSKKNKKTTKEAK